MLGYDFPLLSLILVMFVFFVLVELVVAFIWAFIDNFRRHDHSGWAKAGWAMLLLLIPIIGLFIYLIARPAEVALA